MTTITLSWQQPPTKASFFSRRTHAFFRLMRIHRRQRARANALYFADDRVLVDVGIQRKLHQYDWLMALCR
jgi:hypothetical protein